MRFVGIDPATRTGFVALDENGNVLVEMELKGAGKAAKGGITIQQLVDLENQLYKHLQEGDEIVVEQAAAGTQMGITTGMIHGGLRSMIVRKKLAFNEINPAWTKKYVGVSGWTGDAGNKRRLTGAEKKAEVKAAAIAHFGYPAPGMKRTDNIIDAYIMARVAWNLYLIRELRRPVDSLPYQLEVVQSILDKAQ
ncbi:hypothetical protein [Paenibacillus methanolicus]|uniref:Crossover junction endodeoxyribonuclease RuvC n=1 Tax=Paenibacillus methanolicus TaxID=582686 RepID=A0A5S5BK44_9BACL|nr:hypothetical protein [Paenibacillus methanolicus]TYP67405.1 crossover junction endodeoxyribonuclease RuvC [Paenibacillus methanolicus]